MTIKEIDLGIKKHEDTPDPSDVIGIMEYRHPEMMESFRKIQQEQYELFAQKQMAYGKGNIMLGGDIGVDEDRVVFVELLFVLMIRCKDFLI